MKLAERILVAAAVSIFLGRGYQYFFWDAPLRVFFWDESLFSPFVENVLGLTWEDYAADLRVDRWLSQITSAVGVFFAFCAMAAIALYRTRKAIFQWVLYGGSILLLLHALLETKDHFYHVGQLFEHSIQVLSPILLAVLVLRPDSLRWIVVVAKIAIALTFTAHGLYALGFYPVPGHFVDMTLTILGITGNQARSFLFVVGWLDIIFSVLLFVKSSTRFSLVYMAAWGFLTALARIVYGFNPALLVDSLHSYLYMTVFRLAHGLVPLATLYLIRGTQLQRQLTHHHAASNNEV